jgi:beta-mannosidase
MIRKEKWRFPDERSDALFTIETILEIWGTNKTLVDKKATLEVTFFDLHSGWRDRWRKGVILSQNSSTELYSGNLSGQPVRSKKSEVSNVVIVSARLLDANGMVLGRHSNWWVRTAN